MQKENNGERLPEEDTEYHKMTTEETTKVGQDGCYGERDKRRSIREQGHRRKLGK